MSSCAATTCSSCEPICYKCYLYYITAIRVNDFPLVSSHVSYCSISPPALILYDVISVQYGKVYASWSSLLQPPGFFFFFLNNPPPPEFSPFPPPAPLPI